MSTGAEIIPVIDLMRGQVVRARQGARHAYLPIESALCRSSEPVTVARVLLAHCAARRLYVADLDALMGGPAQLPVLRALLQALPEIDELWLDAGFVDSESAAASIGPSGPLGDLGARIVPVLGSESLASRAALARSFAPDSALGSKAVLSLDRRDGRRLDAAGCWEAPELWPPRVIVMTLERVGAGSGPDLSTLQAVRAMSPKTEFIGAGGVRSAADLVAAANAGAAAWLVASALHDLQIPARPS